MLLTSPQRSASNEIGSVVSPTISGTMLTSEPSCVSDRVHSAFRKGNTATMTYLEAKSEIISRNVRVNTLHTYSLDLELSACSLCGTVEFSRSKLKGSLPENI
jgi:hypothetical protein